MPPDHLIRMPQLGLTMTEGTVVEWLVEPGQQVAAGDLLYVVETDKIANEIAADRAGVFGQRIVPAGDTVKVGAVIGAWQVDGAPPATAVPAAETRAPGDSTPAVHTAAAPPARVERVAGARLIATPHARKLARLQGVDLTSIAGSGPRGRIRAADLLATAAPAPAPSLPAPVAGDAGTRHALTATQRVTAERLTQAQREVPHFYLTADAGIGELLHYHEFLKHKPGIPRLTITHWIATAVGLVLEEQPLARTVYAGGEYLVLAGSDVGIAVATDKGLYAPLARALGTRGLADNAAHIEALVARTRAGRLASADLAGGATTISNLGAARVTRVFPMINPGQSSILGVGRTTEVFRPDGSGQPLLRRELGLVLACDHRVYNGVDGARVLDAIVALLEDPLLILAKTRRS